MDVPATTFPPLPCPRCGHPDDWRQVVRLIADYDILAEEDGTYRFGDFEPDTDAEETLRYECRWCGTEADAETREAIEGRIR